MGKISRFEDIVAWQKARVLNKLIYDATLQLPFSRDFALVDQIRRSSISILSNIAEGFERKGVQEFLHFLNIAKASGAELRAQLYVASDLGYLTDENAKSLINMATEIGKMINGLMLYLEKNKSEGNKFHEPESTYGNKQGRENLTTFQLDN